MNKNEELKKWLVSADNDLIAVNQLKNNHPPLIEIICFHCQQSAEKHLKAYLFYKDSEIKKTHNLEELCKICSDKDKDFDWIKNQCIDLTDYAVEIRYPYPFELNISDMEKAILDAEIIKDFILKKLI